MNGEQQWRNRTRSAKLMNITAMAAFGTLGYFVAKIPLASEEIAFFPRGDCGGCDFGVATCQRQKISSSGQQKKPHPAYGFRSYDRF